jgi:hypothetical protein
MHMHKFYLIIILFISLAFIFPVKAMAQEQDLTIMVNLQWQPFKELFPGHSLLFFEGAVNHDSLGFLPVYQYSIPQTFPGKVADVKILEGVYEPAEMMDPSDFPDLDLIEIEPRIIITTLQTRRNPQQFLFLLPLRKIQGKEGFERLVSFKLLIRLTTADQTPEQGRESIARSYADHSVLRTGDWYRIAVKDAGIYKITYQDLEGMGIDPGDIDPRNIRLYGNGNGMLEEANSTPRADDLMENAIFLSGEEDGQFDPGDYILFYGESPVTIEYNPFYLQYEHEINFYTDETYYFLNTGSSPGKRVQQAGVYPVQPTHEVYTFQELAFHEKEEVNLIKSGKIWYGEVFNTQTEYNFPFDLAGIDLSEPIYLKLNLAGRTTTKTVFNVFAEGKFITELEVPSIVLGSQIYARPITSNYEMFYADDENVDIGVNFDKLGSIDIGWLNYIELNYIRHLKFTGGQLGFRDARPVGEGNTARYHFQTSISGLRVWDVTNPGDIAEEMVTEVSGSISIQVPADILREFIAFDGSHFYTPVFIEKVENQDLHSLVPADFIIIAYPLFIDQAHRLADYHRQYDGLTAHVVTPQKIYNEFSSGAQDVSAIRDFLKMLYDRAEEGEEPGYLLLFGDASYDYKDYIPEDNNLVPTYESRESLKSAASFVTDDFFGCFDIDEGSNGSGTMDIGIGRFPVHTLEQAEAMVNKTINYMVPARENFGPWRNNICYIGDDEDNNTHLGQAEGLALITDSLGTVFNINKIYLDAYLQFKTPGGDRYPDANVAIDKAVNDGCLLVNYTGHGGEIAWAGERVLDIPAIQSYRNIHQLPAFVTATCEFSRYDDPGLVSAGELVFLNPDGAGIGLFTTTRLAFSQSNYALNKRFYYEAFIIDSLTGESPRMGDLIRVAKTPSNQNIKNFVLLGDPALMLAYPKMRVKTLSIKNEGDGRPADTIHALSRITVEGQVEDLQGNILEGFNGILYSSVFDKPVLYKTRGNDPSSRVTDFYIQDKIIFKGEASVHAGKFSFTFIVPMDISYQFGEGKISYYAFDTVNLIDAHGYDMVLIGGSDNLAVADEQGPDIEIFLNTLSFSSGDITTPDPMLMVQLFDSSGINTVGNGIGHDIVAIIDDNYHEPLVLNDYFTPETDSYQKGDIQYRIGPFANGLHTLTLKVWDVLNNSSEKTIEFQVDSGARLSISNLQSRPNPYYEGTSFFFENNKPGSALDVTIRIYSLMGKLLTALEYSVLTESTESGLLYWNGKDASGNELPPGLYVYTLVVKSDDGYVSSLSQKLLHIK